jgi:hypothetical protein
MAALIVGALAVSPAQAAPPTPGTVHVRGTVQTLSGGILTVLTATGPVAVRLPLKPGVTSVLPSDRSQIKSGSFLGIASVPGPGGKQTAREVVVFPESGRGTGEGSYAWDLPGSGGAGHSKMTNGTVSQSRMTNGTAMHSRMTNGTVKGASGGVLTLQYKSGSGMGSQTIALPPGIPVVTFGPGQVSQLIPGAHVMVFGHKAGGGVLADRVLVGKNGVVPPM